MERGLRTFPCTPDPRTSCQSVSVTPSAESLATAWLRGCVESRASAEAKRRRGVPPVRGVVNLLPGDAASVGDAGNEKATGGKPVLHSQAFTKVGLPIVRVPVLSKSTAVTWPAFSRATPSRIKMPRCAAAFEPAIIAAGVANPIAHGQAIINTAAAMIKAAANRPEGGLVTQRK